jgi:aspartate-semialdehyde dehydrogenase
MILMNIGIFGATGMVGKELIKVLSDRSFPVKSLRLYASRRSAGEIVKTPFGEIAIEDADEADFSSLDLAFFAIGGSWPEENILKAIEADCVVVDNSSTFRYDGEVPLVIPEINSNTIEDSLIIANPNCTTAIAAIPLWKLYKKYGLKKVIISTYQAASGAGNDGMNELLGGTKQYLAGETVKNEVFQHPLPFNVIPHIDTFQENLYTREEMKVVWEIGKIFGDREILISCTCVRVPTLRTHAETIIVETERPCPPDEVRKLFEDTDGIVLKDDSENDIYPMPLTAGEHYAVEVGRVRQNLVFGEHGIEFFVCGDQLLKGAALNAVQIAEAVGRRL